jgi:hypothetical protein
VLCGHPRRCVGRPVSTPQHCAAHSRIASTSHPSKEDGGTLKRRTTAYSAPAWDGAVTSGQQGAFPPSLPALCGHPGHFSVIPGTVEARDDRHHHTRHCASSDPPSAQPSSRRTDGNQTRSSRATTVEAAPESQDSPRRPPEARFSRTTINSTTLCASARDMRHDCKLPPLGL